MKATLVEKTKWFWTWQDDKEEAWLGEMARQGLHLAKAMPLGQYAFLRGEPKEVVYRLDFIASGKKDEAYFQLFRDAGWEHVGQMTGWQYWRKEVKPGETAEIFSDNESKVQKYRRVMFFLVIVFLPMLFAMFNVRNVATRPLDWGEWINWVFGGIWGLTFLMELLYLVIFIRLGMRIRELRRL